MTALSDLAKMCFRGNVVPEMKRESEIFASVAAACGEISAHQHPGELHLIKSNLKKSNPTEEPLSEHTKMATKHLAYAAKGGDTISMKLLSKLNQTARVCHTFLEEIEKSFDEMKSLEWSEERESWHKKEMLK